MVDFGRLITAMITPFDLNGHVDFLEARKLASRLVENGCQGFVITGTTGESPNLSNDEKLRLYSEVKEEIGNSAAVIAGTTDNNTAASVELSQQAEKLGVDGLLLTVPSYNKPPQDGLIRHFETIAGNVNLPCMLYNVPGRTSLNMTAETTLKLSEIENIVGIKEASSDPTQIAQIIRDSQDDFNVWSGNDDETFPIMCMGGYGIVSVASHVVCNQISMMIGMILEGDIESAASEHLRLLDIFKGLFMITSPIPVKYAVGKFGFNVGEPRLPLVAPDPETAKKLDALLDRYEIDL
jgi:4-hydroxy-tetrahydrodipicolinate synthase